MGCKKPLVVEQTALDRYRPLAVRVEEDRDRADAAADSRPEES